MQTRRQNYTESKINGLSVSQLSSAGNDKIHENRFNYYDRALFHDDWKDLLKINHTMIR